MEHSFWHARWTEGRIGFHEPAANPLLTTHFDQLNLSPGDTIFVPLCGKTIDIDWLLSKGLRVSGIEFHPGAVDEVFARLGLTAETTEIGPLTRSRAGDLTLFSGDVFELSAETLGPVNAIYDRAAIVALPPETRPLYAAHLSKITATAPQLLIGFDYDQTLSDGPPFSVPLSELTDHYAAQYRLDKLAEHPLDGPLGQRTQGLEQTWLLSPT
ncbi:MAG: thiopurine S-methyltransferase [Pelagimonas sp.]|uniref:thiopurine S-methyltransferase n=1 Tax=Pelagimonas sp. TaxID=2073170 RepID=UPI003D6C6554